MIVQRLYSIQSGGPQQAGSLKQEISARAKAGAAAGGILGSIGGLLTVANGESVSTGLGIAAGSAILGAIATSLTALGANSRRAKAQKQTTNDVVDALLVWDEAGFAVDENTGDIIVADLKRYIVEDKDPRNFMMSFGFEDGKLVMALNKPSDKLIEVLNKSLDTMVKWNRKADYASEEVNNGYLVYVTCPDTETAIRIIYDVICLLKIKINAFTFKAIESQRLKG